jgi:predicted phosphoadenosine phosphosulfate sulfurtransferase
MIIQKSLDIDVVEAAKQRIIKLFSYNLPVVFSFSGGKDSLCLGHLIYNLILENKIDKNLLTIRFIDEEAMYDDVIEIVKDWRQKFLQIGVDFRWYCVEVKHYNCFNKLQNDETYICWDSTKSDVWVRQPPEFAIRDSIYLNKIEDNYQSFLYRYDKDKINILGVRTAESAQRLSGISKKKSKNFTQRPFMPIFDWTDNDVWLYLYENKITFPEVYIRMYQTGVNKRRLRISQFFSIDTASSLVRMQEYYPDLMTRIIKREPNAYLAALYWDSEMFKRNTRKRKRLEKSEEDDNKDYKKLFLEYISDDRNFTNELQQQNRRDISRFVLKISHMLTQKEYKQIYEVIKAGDPKRRNLRGWYTDMVSNSTNREGIHIKRSK